MCYLAAILVTWLPAVPLRCPLTMRNRQRGSRSMDQLNKIQKANRTIKMNMRNRRVCQICGCAREWGSGGARRGSAQDWRFGTYQGTGDFFLVYFFFFRKSSISFWFSCGNKSKIDNAIRQILTWRESFFIIENIIDSLIGYKWKE